VATNKVLASRAALNQVVYFVCCSIVDRYSIPSALNIEGQVLSHDGKTDQAEITQLSHFS
jgi:hypothetical protein